jgi:hypothetical protein
MWQIIPTAEYCIKEGNASMQSHGTTFIAKRKHVEG